MNAHQRRVTRRTKKREFIQWLDSTREELGADFKAVVTDLNAALAMLHKATSTEPRVK